MWCFQLCSFSIFSSLICCFPLFFSLSFFKNIFYCTLGSGIHVQIMQACCIGTHMAVWFAVSIHPSPTSGISPCVIPPWPPDPPAVAPLAPHYWLHCVMLFSLCPRVLIVQHPPMSENMSCLIICSCVSLLRMMVSRFIHVPTKDTNSSFFYGCTVFHGVYVPHFLCLVYHQWAFGLVLGLCYCKQCHNEHSCACVFIIECFIIFWVYTQ